MIYFKKLTKIMIGCMRTWASLSVGVLGPWGENLSIICKYLIVLKKLILHIISVKYFIPSINHIIYYHIRYLL